MADIQTTWVGGDQGGVWARAGADLASDDGLLTAVIISLFTDAPASALEAANAGLSDRRGWWGDAYADEAGDVMGSKLWLLRREKRTAATLERARQYATEALAWLVSDGVAESVAVTAEAVGTDVLGLQVTVTRKREPTAKYRFERFWTGA